MILVIMVFFIGVCFAPNISGNIKKTSGNKGRDIIYVNWDGSGDYTTIQEGINAANPGDTVFVFNGTYYENVIIDKTLNLIGEDKNYSIIDGGGTGDVLYLSTDYINVTAFTIQNSGFVGYPNYDAGIDVRSNYNTINNNIIRLDCLHGMYIITSSNNTIINNNISTNYFGMNIVHSCIDNNISSNTLWNNSGMGIRFYNSNNNDIINNSICSNTLDGLALQEFSNNNTIINNVISNNGDKGIELDGSSNNIISENEVHNNFDDGITLNYQSSNNIISENNITNNIDDGIQLYSSCNDNNIFGNNFIGNVERGIQVTVYSDNNMMYHNNFINNTQNAYDEGCNYWHNQAINDGNYWSDFDESFEGAWDNDSNGIVDSPYQVTGNGNKDYYPLMHPLTCPPHFVWVDAGFTEDCPRWQIDHFDTIQDGIDAVAENGTVFVYNSLYYENIVIDKSLTLVGEDKNYSIIDGGGTGDVLYLSSDWIKIIGFTIQHSGFVGYPNYDAGIDIRSNYNTINNNIIQLDCLHGIYTKASSNNTITSNTIIDNYAGINIVQSCNNNNISSNIVSNNSGMGIRFYSSNSNDILDNILCSNSLEGLALQGFSDNNTIMNNCISNNDKGIKIEASFNNIIYHNILSDNTQNVHDEGNNIWDFGYPLGGNYFDDYTGEDHCNGPNQDIPGSDGIGDTLYNISSGYNQDLYPFMIPDGWLHPQIPGDTNGDGIVNVEDLLIVLAQWGTSGPEGDVNSDGLVNVSDLLIILANWG